ncbi:Plug domain-containing protein [Haloflavibacter putidus]|uniref:Plug domain-containing protein n=1 Tax=Haloflavibacter putidus TaxID=2576776 RepID=A0A507ZVR8_9FLAO|nr:Plug domain-containing protein [Haloflavibacter putidus]TQD39788.1 Plug domain-containing protein [Haloflavibacter putidus]
MKNRFLLGFLCFLVSFFSTSQTKPDNIKDLQEAYSSFFALEREVPYLHLNKTSFIGIENLWFAAYTFNLQHLKNTNLTTNLNVAIYDSKGENVRSKILFIENGYGAGNFNLIHLKPGDYLIKASSRYSKNFSEHNHFTQQFTILGGNTTTEDTKTSTNTKYDLQLLPEGGHLLENALNTIAVKLINNEGKSLKFKEGRLLKEGKLLSRFKSSPFGTASFNINPQITSNYLVEIELENGKILTKKLPQIEEHGLTLTCNIFAPKEIIVAVKTNQQSIDFVKNKNYSLIVRQAGKMQGIGFQISEKDLASNLHLKKSKLFPGVNTITIFNENFEPILERLVFNRTNILRHKIELADVKNLGDSLSVKLQLATAHDSLALNKISISTLPEANEHYKPNNNSLSAYYLKPYVKGHLENAASYFSQNGSLRKQDYYLDLLLKTQGWSRYEWHKIYNSPPKKLFDKETGFKLSGKIKDINYKKEKTALIKSKVANLFEIVDLKPDGSFVIDSAYIVNKTRISVGTVNNRNNKLSKNKLYGTVFPGIDSSDFKEVGKYIFQKQTTKKQEKNIDYSNFIEGDNILDSIVLTASKQRTRNKRSTTFSEITTVTEDLSKSYLYITDYIAQQGFDVHRHPGRVEVFSRRLQNFGGPPAPVIVIDGAPFFDNEGSDFLMSLRTDEVESIEIRKTGSSEFASQGTGGVIRIKTAIDSGVNSNRATTQSFIANSGFTEPDEYYSPKYKYYSPEFQEFGVIDWKAMLEFDKNGELEFKIPNRNVSKINLYIEGFSQNGYFISEELHLSEEETY